MEGAEEWSWADIEPNWTFDDRTPGINPWNEIARETLKKEVKSKYSRKSCTCGADDMNHIQGCPRWFPR